MRYTPNDTLILEVPPVVSLKYPVPSGTEWLFKTIEGLMLFIKNIGALRKSQSE